MGAAIHLVYSPSDNVVRNAKSTPSEAAAEHHGILFCPAHVGTWVSKPRCICLKDVRDCPDCRANVPSNAPTPMEPTSPAERTAPARTAQTPARDPPSGPPSFNLVLIGGRDNHANCDGAYDRREGVQLNGKPVYVNAAKQRFIGFGGTNWVLTGMKWFDEITRAQSRGFGGFHSSTNGDVPVLESTWRSYSLMG